MKRNMKKLVSYVMLLAFMAVSVFANDGFAKAATVMGDDDGIQQQGNVYTVTKNITNDEFLIITLSDDETIVLDGAGHTVNDRFVQVKGKGTLVLKDITISSNAYQAAPILLDGENVNLVMTGKKPIVLKSDSSVSNSTYGIESNSGIKSSATKSKITMEEGTNVTIYGQDMDELTENGYDGKTNAVINSSNECLINVSPKANLTMVNGNSKSNGVFVEYGSLITSNVIIPKRLVEPGKNSPYEDFTASYFSIVNKTATSTISTVEYAGSETSVSKDSLPTYLDGKHEFVGYYTDAACTTPLGDTFDYSGASKTVYAKWNQTKADVSFNTNGGSAVEPIRVNINGTAAQPANPTKSGYTFGGWFKNSSCTQAYDFNAVVTSDITLFAKWTKNSSSTASTKPASKKYSVSKSIYKANSKVMNKKILSTFKEGKLKFAWGKVKGATGYKIYAAKCGSKLKLVKTVKGENETEATLTKINGKKLSNKESYKVYAVAYKTVSKKSYNFGKSMLTHCAGTNNKKYTNVSSIEAKNASKTLAVKKTTTMKVTTKKSASKKSLLPTSHCNRVRFFSSNDSIATVSASGQVTAKKKGKCSIYAVAMNGRCTKMKITVK